MSNKKISQLPSSSSVTDSDLLIINDDGVTKTATRKALLDGITRNVTDGTGNDAVVAGDLNVENEVIAGGDIFTTGNISFGSLTDHLTGVTALTMVDSGGGIASFDSSLATSEAIREYVSSNVISTTLDLVDSNYVISASASALNEVRAEIQQEGDRITVIAQDITQLSADLIIVNDDISANGTAVSNLSTRIDQESDRISVVSQDLTTLTATVNNLDTSANGTAISNLSTRVDLDSARLSVVSSDITSLTASINDPTTGLSANASAVSSLTATVNNLGDASTVCALELNSNNHIAGIRLENDGSAADFVITADTFKIVNASNNAVTPFAIDGSNIALNGNVTINGTLSSTQLVGDVAEIYSFSKGSGAGGATVGSFGLTVETQEIYIPPPTGGVSKRPFIDGRIILSPFSGATYQNYVVEIKYISGPTFETTLTGYLGDISSDFSSSRNFARYSGNYTDRVVSGGIIYTAADNARGFYGANYDLATNETLFLYDDDDGPIGNNSTWTLAPSSATNTSDLNRIGVTSGGGTGENARISDVVIPFSGILPSTTAPQGITLAITWKVLGYAGAFNGYLRSLEANYGYQR